MERHNDEATAHRTDWPVFVPTVRVILLLSVPMVAFKDQAAGVITAAYDAITKSVGLLYLWYGTGAVAFLVWLAFGRYGKVRLGDADSRPEFSTLSWVGMLCCAGVGAGLLYWAVIEWGYYIDKPPYGLEPRSTSAIEWAAGYGLFHWGITGWAIFCLPGITASDQALLFEKFSQVGDTLTAKPQGTGLGLAISKEIIEHHGGRIWLSASRARVANSLSACQSMLVNLLMKSIP